MNILGVDEAGRGALAGPLVAAAVALSQEDEEVIKHSKIIFRDSKTLSAKQRERVVELLNRHHIRYVSCSIDANQINNKGIQWANCEAIRSVIQESRNREHSKYSEVIVDGRFLLSSISVPHCSIRCQIDADATELSVILAGIVAKVIRDHCMQELHQTNPQYCWNQNKGYGTKKHIEAIRLNGITEHHRTLFVTTALSKK